MLAIGFVDFLRILPSSRQTKKKKSFFVQLFMDFSLQCGRFPLKYYSTINHFRRIETTRSSVRRLAHGHLQKLRGGWEELN